MLTLIPAGVSNYTDDDLAKFLSKLYRICFVKCWIQSWVRKNVCIETCYQWIAKQSFWSWDWNLYSGRTRSIPQQLISWFLACLIDSFTCPRLSGDGIYETLNRFWYLWLFSSVIGVNGSIFLIPEDYIRYAHGLVSDYLSIALGQELKDSMGWAFVTEPVCKACHKMCYWYGNLNILHAG